MASEENHNNVFPEDDLDDDEDDSEEEEQQQPLLDDEDDDVLGEGEEIDDALEEDEDLNSASSADPTTVTVAVPPPVIATTTTSGSGPDPKRQRVEESSPIASSSAAAVVHHEEKKQQLQQPMDEARRLFQRLWTDEDEIELLQGFLEYTTQRGSSQHHHHDTALFYDQIKSKLQLDFNKNQLVEKLRRLKKKYRNVVSRISSGKEFVFKTPHDQATFEISRKIWGDAGRAAAAGVTGIAEDGGFDDEEPNANSHHNANPIFNNSSVNNHGNNDVVDQSSAEKKGQRSRKRSRVKVEEKRVLDDKAVAASVSTPVSSVPGLVEETVRSCLSPLFKELLNNAMNGPCGGGSRGFGGGLLSPIPLNFGGSSSLGNLLGGEMVDEKWRKQQILELEVYSKRLELVQDQIKATLEELRSVGS